MNLKRPRNRRNQTGHQYRWWKMPKREEKSKQKIERCQEGFMTTCHCHLTAATLLPPLHPFHLAPSMGHLDLANSPWGQFTVRAFHTGFQSWPSLKEVKVPTSPHSFSEGFFPPLSNALPHVKGGLSGSCCLHTDTHHSKLGNFYSHSSWQPGRCTWTWREGPLLQCGPLDPDCSWVRRGASRDSDKATRS